MFDYLIEATKSAASLWVAVSPNDDVRSKGARMTQPTVLMTGIALGESPRWHDGRLWFCDWVARRIIAADDAGNHEVVVENAPSLPFCIDWLPDGRLLIVAGRDGLLLRRENDGSLSTHADLSEVGRPPWNEIVVDGRGNIYVNTIGFDFPGGEFAPGSIALVRPDGSVGRVADGLAFPNGMVVTPDNATLIVAESYASRLTAFDIAADGSLASRRIWAEVEQSAPDGICLDADNAVWYADVPNQRCVRVREGGEVLRTIELDRGGFACVLGGAERRTLFMLAADWRGAAGFSGPRTGLLLATEAPVPASGWP
jgi:sugar lactone lactonase YvrE